MGFIAVKVFCPGTHEPFPPQIMLSPVKSLKTDFMTRIEMAVAHVPMIQRYPLAIR